MPEDTGVAQLLAARRAAREAEVAARAVDPQLTETDMLTSQRSDGSVYSNDPAQRGAGLRENIVSGIKSIIADPKAAGVGLLKGYRNMEAAFDTDPLGALYDSTIGAFGNLAKTALDPTRPPEENVAAMVSAMSGGRGIGGIPIKKNEMALGSFFGRGSAYPDVLDAEFVEKQNLLKKTIADPNSSQLEVDQAMRALMENGLFARGGRIAFDQAEQYPARTSDDLYKDFGITRLLDGTLLGEISDKGAGWKPDFVKQFEEKSPKVSIPDYATAAVQQLNDIYVRDGNLDSVRLRDSKPKSDLTQTYNLSDEEFLRKIRVDPLLLVGTRVQLDKPDILKRLGGYGHEDVQDIMDISPDELPQALQENYQLGELSPKDGEVITRAQYDKALEDYVVSNFKKSYNANPKSYGDYATELARIKDDPGAYLDAWGNSSDVLKSIGGTGKEHLNDSYFRRGNDVVAVLDNSKEAKLREEFLEKGMPDKKLEDIYDHPELFKAYPQLKDVKIFIEGTKSKAKLKTNYNYSGYWDLLNNRIVFANAKYAKDFFSSEDTSETMIHELDHAISDLEGRAGIYKPQGAASSYFDEPQDRKDFVAQMITNTQAEIEKLQLLKSPSGKDLQDIAWYKDKIKEYENRLVRAEEKGDVGYYSTLGEFTARLAELRKNMSAKELANNPPPIIPFGRLVKPEAVSSIPSSNLNSRFYQFQPDINSSPSPFKDDADYLKSLTLGQK